MNKDLKNRGNGRLLISLKEAALSLSMCSKTVMKFVYQGDLPCVRFSKNSVFFNVSDLESFIEKYRIQYDPTEVPTLSEHL